METPNPTDTHEQFFTVFATPRGLVLSTPNGQFLLQTTVGDPQRMPEPAMLMGIDSSDPRALSMQALDLM